jgi:hypothetical protein
MKNNEICENGAMNAITLQVERDESGWLVAPWHAPDGRGGLTTQGRDLRESQEKVKEAILCHFEQGEAPRAIRLALKAFCARLA